MKEFVQKYRLLRQRTVREETTKVKARALPLAFYTKQQDYTKVHLLAGLGNHFNSGNQPEGSAATKAFQHFDRLGG